MKNNTQLNRFMSFQNQFKNQHLLIKVLLVFSLLNSNYFYSKEFATNRNADNFIVGVSNLTETGNTTSGVYTHATSTASGYTNVATLNLNITVNTFIVGTSCGATITSLAVTVNTPIVVGAKIYTFRIKNMATNAILTIVRSVNSFSFSNFPGITLGTTYQIEVRVNEGPFGPPCILKTPTPTATIGAHCGTTVSSMSQYVYCTAVSSVTGYRFRVRNLTTSEFAIVDATLNRFNFNDVSLPVRAFGTTYVVEVALKNTDGSYLPYSSGCNISTRPFPTTTITAEQCGLSAETAYNTNLEAIVFSGATEYRFKLSNVALVYSATVTKLINKIKLSEFSGVLPGESYTVEVSLKINGAFGPYGASCSVTTPEETTKAVSVVSNEFKSFAYPNPFDSNFLINVNTMSENTFQIKVYDMLGKQIDNRNVEVSELENLQIGTDYPSGVYNVIVIQGEGSKTIRVIKR